MSIMTTSKWIFALAVAVSADASATATSCSNVSLRNADRMKIRASFESRYCAKVTRDRCDLRHRNFDQLLERIISDDRTQHIPLASFMLATAFVETFSRDFAASTKEVRGNVNDSRPYWKTDPETKQSYFGRGWLQLTWKDKYQRAKREIKVDVVNNPDLALQPSVAFEILLLGLTQGWIETYRSSPNGNGGNIPISVNDFLYLNLPDYASARAAVNANCVGKCSKNDRVKIGSKGYIPVPAKLDAALKTEVEAQFFEQTLCLASLP